MIPLLLLQIGAPAAVVVNPSGGGRIYGYLPPEPKKRKRRKVIRLPEPYEVSGPLSSRYEHARLPDWDQEAWEASLKTLNYLEGERCRIRRRTDAALLALLLD